ncbi:DUF4340 domain-containing protein [bacterium]|nr:DUF4340 domain-containing protein [bacterium]
MKVQHLKIFAGVFVFLLAIYFITRPRHQSVNLDELVQNIVFGVAEDDVRAIEIYKNTGGEAQATLQFAKQDEQWRIPSYFNAKAQNGRVESLISDLITMTGKVRSDSPEHLAAFGITDNQGVHILLKDETGKTLTNLILGRRPEDSGSSFVRFAGNEKVYFADKSIHSRLSLSGSTDTLTTFNAKSFVDLQAVQQQEDDLEMAALVVNGREMILKKVEREVDVTKPDSTAATETRQQWVLMRGEREVDLDQEKVTSFFRDISTIRALEVVDRIGNSLADINKSRQYGTARPATYLVFKKPDRNQENVLFGSEYEKDKGYYMQVQYDGLVYKVSTSVYDKIVKWINELPSMTG